MDIKITVTGLNELARRYQGARTIVGEELIHMVDRVTTAGSAESQRHVGVKTGTLRRSLIPRRATFAGGVARGAWGSNVPYARIHNDGRGPVVARGRALRFVIGGRVFYRKRVGPARGRRYMEAGATLVRSRIGAEGQAAARRIAARLAGSR